MTAGEHVAPNAACLWELPTDSTAALAGLIAFDWDSVSVYEEDEEVFAHPRDPYTRIDVLRSVRHVWVAVGDLLVADSTRPRMLLESGLPVRWYLPPEDVRTDLLESSDTTPPRCPYKSTAALLVAADGQPLRAGPGVELPQAVPRREAVRGLLCFPQGRVELQVTPSPSASPQDVVAASVESGRVHGVQAR